jgi:hypothetical protein
MKLLIMQFSPISHHFIPLQSKYSPQHPVFKHHQSTFLPSCQRSSFKPVQNHKQNYGFVYFCFLQSRREHKATVLMFGMFLSNFSFDFLFKFRRSRCPACPPPPQTKYHVLYLADRAPYRYAGPISRFDGLRAVFRTLLLQLSFVIGNTP